MLVIILLEDTEGVKVSYSREESEEGADTGEYGSRTIRVSGRVRAGVGKLPYFHSDLRTSPLGSCSVT